MADETNAPTEKKKGKPLPLLVGIIVILEIGAALAVVKIALPSQEPDSPEAWETKAEPIERAVEDVVVNLVDGGAKRMLKVDVSIRLLAEKPVLAAAAFERPGVIEDRLIGLLSRKRLVDVSGRQEAIKKEIAAMLEREILTEAWQEENGRARITELLMPEFVIQ
jgi:flagellar basal body-associated protein FliL